METILKIALYPFSLVYGLIVFFRNKLYDLNILKSREFDVPVISVGNITAGGTGKTPHVEYLAGFLSKDFRIAVLSRGYKRKTRGFIIADENPDPSLVGDEPCQIKNKFPEITVAVDEKRTRGIEKLLRLPSPPDIILLDDAFQHRSVSPGMNILLADYNRYPGNDLLLPAGRLREPFSSRKRAHIILITKSPADLKAIDRRLIAGKMELDKFQHLYFTTIEPSDLKPVFYQEGIKIPVPEQADYPVLLVAGIANPGLLENYAGNYSANISTMFFSDHHDYSPSDAESIQARMENLGKKTILITTEKDAVKMKRMEMDFENLKEKMFYLPIGVDFLNDDSENFKKQILSYVRDNKRDSILHKGKSSI